MMTCLISFLMTFNLPCFSLILQPKETRLISESGGLFKPDVVAKAALEDALVSCSIIVVLKDHS